ncbi:hypothetical protein [Enterococcus sp. DIV1059_2]|uniref:hypothetical protein n=1 Tax=Enterococcus sp. DIV1059_2 TaxID=2774664 RepID=UPI003F27D66A
MKKTNKGSIFFVVFLSSIIFLIQGLEVMFLPSNSSDMLGLSALPIIIGIFAGGPTIGIPLSVIWTASVVFVTPGIHTQTFVLLGASRLIMAMTIWWAYSFFKITKASNYKSIFYSILSGVIAKRLYFYFYYKLTNHTELINFPSELLTILFQTFFYGFCVHVVIQATIEYSRSIR